MAMPLFEQVEQAAVAPAVRMQRAGDGWLYWCPHCGRETYAVRAQTDIESNPSCAHCRAESKGMSFSEWRRLPMEERLATRPAESFRSQRPNAFPVKRARPVAEGEAI